MVDLPRYFDIHYESQNLAVVSTGGRSFLRAPIKVDVNSEERERIGTTEIEYADGTTMINLDDVTILGWHGFYDEYDHGGQVTVLRYSIGDGDEKWVKLDVSLDEFEDAMNALWLADD